MLVAGDDLRSLASMMLRGLHGLGTRRLVERFVAPTAMGVDGDRSVIVRDREVRLDRVRDVVENVLAEFGIRRGIWQIRSPISRIF